MQDRSVTFRPVSPGDENFLFQLYSSTRAEELAGLPFDETQRETFLAMQYAAQRRDYERRFPEGEHQVILMGDQPIGRVYLVRREEEIRILDIALVPELRNRGIGSSIISTLLKEAVQHDKPVRIYVEQWSASLKLFERLGFRRTEDVGTHFLMEWRHEDSER